MAMARSAMAIASLGATIAAWGAGCGGNSATVSCAVSENDGSLGVLKICLEAPASTFSQGCPAPTPDAGIEVSVMEGPCSRVGAVGGCRIATGAVTETVWYYADGVSGGSGPTSSDIQMVCAEGHATFVAP
jgi:hypothetical protein